MMSSNLREIDGNVTLEMKNIEHDGPLVVKGNVESGSFIVATGDIGIAGDVSNSKIKSIKGNITIEGGVKGVSSILFAGGGDIKAKFVYNSTLKAEKNVILGELSVDAHIIAKKSIYIEKGEGFIEGGEIEAGLDIVANVIGTPKFTSTIIKISDFEERERFSKLIRYDREIKKINQEIGKLQKFIEVIRILGKKVVSLPIEKKTDLALKVKKYNDLREQLTEVNFAKNRVKEIRKQLDELERTVIIKDTIYSGVYIYMDKVKLYVQQKYHNVILYKRGIIIIGDYDQFMRRKKYSY